MPFVPCEALPTAPARDPHRLGAHLEADGADFVVYAGHATAMYVALFERASQGLRETRYMMHHDLYGIWHAHIPGVSAGQLYGYRAYGEWDPACGKRYNEAKVLLDPYTRGIGQSPTLHPALYSHRVNDDLRHDPEWLLDERDSAPFAALGVVMEEDDSTPGHVRIPWNETVIYEAHVASLTKNRSDLPEALRGTYAGIAHPSTVAYLKELGITSLELLPIHAKMSEPFLTQLGLENYWGYNTLSFFAPEPSYATAENRSNGPEAVLAEFKAMVAALHEAGIEVILDVVYNHTCEASETGPTLSLRGFDSFTYYRHDPHNPGRFVDTTACGNSLDFRNDQVIRLTLDSLRYWVERTGIDGFRFDLASTLSRLGDTFEPHHPLYVAMATDPLLSGVKLINEPWDVAPGGWQTGNFPQPTADWNDHFRDSLRSFWLSEPARISAGGTGADLRDFATRLSGSADLFGHGSLPGGRGVHASINFITAHDGFTLRDLTSYNTKHNEANLEHNRDGSNSNHSWNHGIEGESQASEEVNARRRQSARNLMASLLFSAGTPMITSGDEMLKTQDGNNNAYCQNSDISYIDWSGDEHALNMLATTQYLLKLRSTYKALRPTSFYTGTRIGADTLLDLEWFDNSGHRMPDYKWFDSSVRVLQMLRSGMMEDADVLVAFNGTLSSTPLTLPQGRGKNFTLVWDSAWEKPRESFESFEPQSVAQMPGLTTRIYVTPAQ
ncbi:MAG: glycogen debranching protein GlgX [Actinomycetaceae bacterium]|nr:glycogen debranching protein GlgX [Actinomycetaceae bacterium]MDY6143524.1 glycogen debranching protein GlgX [Arcanobacterium sp.]